MGLAAFCLQTDTMRIIYAISADGKDSLSYHTPFSRGTRSIYLRQTFANVPTIPDDAITIDITVEDVRMYPHVYVYNYWASIS